MNTLKITFLLLAILLLTVSVVTSEEVVVPDEPSTSIEYSPKDQLTHTKRKRKLKSNA